jgi:hypothetical protein
VSTSKEKEEAPSGEFCSRERGKTVRRVVAWHDRCGNPAVTHSPEGRRRWRNSLRRFDDGWWCSSSTPYVGEDEQVRPAVGASERQWRCGRRGVPGRGRQRWLARAVVTPAPLKAGGVGRQGQRVALGVQRPLTGGPGWRERSLTSGPAPI